MSHLENEGINRSICEVDGPAQMEGPSKGNSLGRYGGGFTGWRDTHPAVNQVAAVPWMDNKATPSASLSLRLSLVLQKEGGRLASTDQFRYAQSCSGKTDHSGTPPSLLTNARDFAYGNGTEAKTTSCT
jgi:hypothetical protein